MVQFNFRSGLVPIAVLLWAALAVPAQAQSLSFAGDTASAQGFMQPLASLWQERGRGTIDLQTAPTHLAIARAATGEVKLGGSSRTVRQADRLERQIVQFPIAWDALVVIVHPSNPVTNIRLQQVADLYRGKTANWGALGSSAGSLQVISHTGPQHGLDVTLAELVLRDSTASLVTSARYTTTDDVIAAVERTPGAIAVVNYSRARKARVKLLQVEGQPASPGTIQSGEYLLYFPLYVGVRSGTQNQRDIREFLRFAGSAEARRVLRRNGVVPYSDGMALTSRQIERAGQLDGLRTDG